MTYRVIVIGPGPGEPGGVGQVMGNLETGISKFSEFEVKFLSTTRKGKSYFSLAVLISIQLATLLISAKFSRIPVVVHLNVASKGSTLRKYFFASICRALRVGYVCHLHGAKYRAFYSSALPLWRRAIGQMFLHSRRVIVLGESWRDFVVDNLNVSPSLVSVVPNGTADIKRSGEWNSKATTRIIFSGRVGARKGVPELLTAVNILRQRGKGFELLLAGDCVDEELKGIALSTQGVILTGWLQRENLIDLLSHSDIFVLPSHDEGLPVSLLEAMSAGLACVTTPVGAIPDAVHHGQNGMLVPVNDPQILADVLSELVDDTDLRRQLGVAARSTWENGFTTVTMTAKIAEVWKEIAADSVVSA